MVPTLESLMPSNENVIYYVVYNILAPIVNNKLLQDKCKKRQTAVLHTSAIDAWQKYCEQTNFDKDPNNYCIIPGKLLELNENGIAFLLMDFEKIIPVTSLL